MRVILTQLPALREFITDFQSKGKTIQMMRTEHKIDYPYERQEG